MRYLAILAGVFSSLLTYGSVDTVTYHHADMVYVFFVDQPTDYIEATEFLIDEGRKTAASDMHKRLKQFVNDTTDEGLQVHYMMFTELINDLDVEASQKELLYQDSKIPEQIIFINETIGVFDYKISTSRNAMKYGSSVTSPGSTIQSLSAGDYLIRAGNSKNKSVIFGVVGVSVSSLLFAVYANNNTDALLYIAAGTGAIGLTASFAFNIKGNKDLKRAGSVMNGF